MELRNECGLRKTTIALQRKASANSNESQAVIRTIFPRKLYNADVSEDMARKIFRFAGAPASRFVDFFRPGDAFRDSLEITKPDLVSPLARKSTRASKGYKAGRQSASSSATWRVICRE